MNRNKSRETIIKAKHLDKHLHLSKQMVNKKIAEERLVNKEISPMEVISSP